MTVTTMTTGAELQEQGVKLFMHHDYDAATDKYKHAVGAYTPEGNNDLAAAMNAEAEKLKSDGRKGYVIPGGGSNALGAMGYVVCSSGILTQSVDKGVWFDEFRVASGGPG